MNTPLVAIILAVGSMLVGGAAVPEPRTGGIYLTGADYEKGLLAYAGKCESKEHKVELHDILNKSHIHVKHGNEKHRYEKHDLFGFRACDGRDYRFVSNQEYQILEARELYVYRHEIWASRGKSGHTDTKYYFSSGSEGEVFPLTMVNLKHSFPENSDFHNSLDQAFGTRRDLRSTTNCTRCSESIGC